MADASGSHWSRSQTELGRSEHMGQLLTRVLLQRSSTLARYTTYPRGSINRSRGHMRQLKSDLILKIIRCNLQNRSVFLASRIFFFFLIRKDTMSTRPAVIEHLTRWQDWGGSITVWINKRLQKTSTVFHQSKAIWLKPPSDTNGIKPVIKDTKLSSICVWFHSLQPSATIVYFEYELLRYPLLPPCGLRGMLIFLDRKRTGKRSRLSFSYVREVIFWQHYQLNTWTWTFPGNYLSQSLFSSVFLFLFFLSPNSLQSCRSAWHRRGGGCTNSFRSQCEALVAHIQ